MVRGEVKAQSTFTRFSAMKHEEKRKPSHRRDLAGVDRRCSEILLDIGNMACRERTPKLCLARERKRSIQACRSVEDYEKLNRIAEGAYGVVYRARDKKSGEVVAVKKVKMENEKEGFPVTSLREINILSSLHHPSIVDMKEIFTTLGTPDENTWPGYKNLPGAKFVFTKQM